MENKVKKRKSAQLIVAVLIALAFWIYMEVYVPQSSHIKVNDIPVEFTNEDTILAENGLMLLSGYDATVDLELEGERKNLMRLDTSKIRIVANTGSITSAGVQSLKYDVILPDNVSGTDVTVKSRSVYSITVTVGKLYSKEIPIKTEIKGQVADGYFTGDISIDPQVLTLRAEREDMLNISYAKVTVNLRGATSTLIETVEYTLYDYNDIPVYSENIRSSTKLIQVTVPVRTTKTVPLEVSLVGTELMESVDVTIEPASVTLVGDGATLDGISSVVLDKIYVEDLIPGLNGPYAYTIKLPAGVSTTDGVSEAIVTVAINGTTEGTVTVDGAAINCEGAADGLRAVVNEPLEVTLWGDDDEIANVTAEDVLVRVDVSEITEAGEYRLPAVVTAVADCGVTVRGSYEVTVTVTRREAPPDTEGETGGESDGTTPEQKADSGAGSTDKKPTQKTEP